ncbi:endolytic transglycosylase MltG [Oceaniglobus ichthyenteri]|uniref:endolytic transglycosylase MltG n=1 Tax=Oceaniglobus ichthyenteri TaxID=2136177 RepID=UPI000D3A1132|nr:endolytic transglycosylase MltG [Oceaniglobus ichthyenteri]
MWRHIASNFLTVFIVLLAAAGALVAWGQSQYNTPGPLAQAICLRVESGSNISRVSQDLQAQGAVSSASIFRIGADYTDKASELKAGSFLVPEGASMAQITDIITRGGASTCGVAVVLNVGVTAIEMRVRELDPATNRYVNKVEFDPATGVVPEEYTTVRDQADVRFSIALAEGVTSWQIVEGLKAAEFLTGEVSEIPPEGSLAPDSYEVRPGADRNALLAQMSAAQTERLAEVWRNRDEDIPISSPEEALILASLIEKETGVPEERPEVAAVFVNRLRQGMRLQTDPTVIYGITNGQGVLGRGLRRSELDRETPYNTYRIDGLPPTPIANPGLASLQAAVNPGESDFLYFVADGTGGHAFAVTLAEHNANVAKWRQIEAERANQ